MLIRAKSSCLLVVDIQAKLAPVMAEPEKVVANTALLLKAARRLDVPLLVSEQYPAGIGHTVPELTSLFTKDSLVQKMHFSCLGEDEYKRRLRALERPQAVVAGIEAHVCVLQTTEDLLAAGLDVFVVADATSSRKRSNHEAALERLRSSGARVVTTEMVMFEWLGKAGTAAFKDIIPLIKSAE
jgi:nicotinamidase-related amidase